MSSLVGRCLVFACAAALLAAAALGGEEKEVPGRGNAAPSIPPVLDDPPSSHTADSHDLDEGEHFTGTEHYDLRQGASPDDKAKWAETDYLYWHAHGASLNAEGQAHDWNPQQTTTVSAEAWGKTGREFNVDSGQRVTVRSVNRIQFSWDYLVAGEVIGEASVQLHGRARDIEGKTHTFSLSDHRSEKTEAAREESQGTSSEAHAGIEGHYGTVGGKPSFRVGGEAGAGKKEESMIHVSIARRLAAAGGDTGSTPEVTLETSYCVPAPPPYHGTWGVYSEGRATLRARASRAAEGEDQEERGPVVVQLRDFRVRNELRVWVVVQDDDRPPEPPRKDGAGCEDAPFLDGVGLAGLGGLAARLSATCPTGLDGEPGSVPGLLGILLEGPAPRDVHFRAEASDPARVVLPKGTLLVAKGSRWGSLPFHGRAPGPTDLMLSVLDEQGEAGGGELRVAVEAASLLSAAAPRLWAAVPGKAWRPAGDLVVHAIRGGDAGPLWIGRTGFAGYATGATVVGIEASDPDGVLASLPGSATIAAGEGLAELPLLIRDAEGTATVVLSAGEETVRVTVVSWSQGWEAPPAIRVPLGGNAPIPFFLTHASDRTYEVAAAAGLGGALAIAKPEDVVRPGERAWFFEARGEAAGESVVTLSAPGLPDLAVRVVVFAPDVELAGGQLHLRDLPAGAEGTIRLTLPEGVVFASLAFPPDSAEYLEATGVGTSGVTLAFTPSPNLPRSLSIPVTLVGDTAGVLEVSVFDTLHPPAEEGTLHSYRIVVR